MKKGYNARYYDNSLSWLSDAGIIIKLNRISKIERPLEAYVELPIFKVFMADSGLLISKLSDYDIRSLLQDETTTYKGAVYKNVVAQILKMKEKRAYYYKPS